MSNTILLRRGTNANLSTLTLQNGEPAFVTDTNKLYIGNGSNKILINPTSYPSADKWTTARTITLGGDLSGSVSVDGSTNVTLTATIADDSHNHIISNIDNLQTTLDAKAPLASPVLTGTPTGPTATAGTNSSQLATTAFVTSAISNATAGNVATATQLATPRTISTTGDASWSVTFDGSANASGSLVLSSSGVAAGTYKSVTVDTKGRVTAGTNPTTLSGYGITDSVYTIKFTSVQDFNTLTTTGVYELAASSNTNAPTATHGRLVVDFSVGTPFQLWYPDNLNAIYKRTYNIATTTWSSWANIITAYAVGLGNVANESKATMFTSPTFTGTPVAPTAATGTDSTQLATTEFVQNSMAAGNSATATKWATSRTITLNGDLTGSVTVDGSANVTLTATVTDDSHNHVISNVDNLQTTLDAKAPLASPALTGIPTAPTAIAGTNTTQLATTAFVSTAVSNLVNAAPGALDTLNELAAALGDDANFSTTMTNALALKAPLDSPALTGTPIAPTAGIGTNSTQLATTAFVENTLNGRTANITFANDATFAFRGVVGTIAANDHWRVGGAATATDSGYMELATDDNGNEPIYVRQYSGGSFSTLIRSATLLDGSGNSSFPGIVSATSFSGLIDGGTF